MRIITCVVLAALLIVGCDDTPAEREQKIENAADATGDALEKGAEKTGDLLNKAADSTADVVNDVVEKTPRVDVDVDVTTRPSATTRATTSP
jgi:archaellum component FlaD/FlaE